MGERAGAGHPWVSHTGVGEPRDGKGKGRPHTHTGAGEAGARGALHRDERGSPVGLRGPHRLPPCRPALVREEESLGWKSGRIAAPTSSHLLRSGTCRLSQQGRGCVSRQGPWGAGVPACFPGCVSGTFWSLSEAWQGPTLAFARVSWGDGSLRRAQEGHEAGPPRPRSSSSRWAPHASRPSWRGAGKRVPERRRRPGRSDAGHWGSRAGRGVGQAGPGSHHCPLGVWRAPRRPSYRPKQTGGPFRSLAFVLPSVRPQKVERRTPTCA